MSRSLSIILSLFLVLPALAKSDSQSVYEESAYLGFKYRIKSAPKELGLLPDNSSICMDSNGDCVTDYSLFIKALSELYFDNELSQQELGEWLAWLKKNTSSENHFHAVWTFKDQFPLLWMQVQAQSWAQSDDIRIQHILNANSQPVKEERVSMARDLIADDSGDGFLRLYMFCRNDRRYPCLFVARNVDGSLVKEGKQIWNQPSLGYSRHNKKFNETNGNTPSGVYTLDGVMPYADRPQAFGKFRRLIMNFIPASKAENESLALLPQSSHQAQWWREASVARDMGRNSLRIHGSGNVAPEGEPYYPFFGTSGCIAQRENTYEGITYIDQRLLLDKLMTVLGYAPEFKNETQIRALLYVINLNDEASAVSLNDLQSLQIIK